jgi:glycosyltransferase involved in cell wall biosynthesis
MWENSANRVFDALAAGRPVTLNYRGWQAELLEREGVGFAVPPGDPSAAAALLTARVADNEWLEDARAAFPRLAYGPFNRDPLAARVADVIDRAVRLRVGR